MIGFGSGYSLTQLGNWGAQNADNFVVASVLGTGPLGVYSRAYNLLSQPAAVIGGAADKVLFPAMARVRDDGERLRAAYVRSASLIALVAAPASVLLYVLAPEVVRVLLGAQWAAVVLPLQVFALVLLPRTTYKISTSLTRATGAVYRAAWRQWLYAAEVVVFCVIGARVAGVDGVAVGAAHRDRRALPGDVALLGPGVRRADGRHPADVRQDTCPPWWPRCSRSRASPGWCARSAPTC